MEMPKSQVSPKTLNPLVGRLLLLDRSEPGDAAKVEAGLVGLDLLPPQRRK